MHGEGEGAASGEGRVGRGERHLGCGWDGGWLDLLQVLRRPLLEELQDRILRRGGGEGVGGGSLALGGWRLAFGVWSLEFWSLELWGLEFGVWIKRLELQRKFFLLPLKFGPFSVF